MTEAKVHCMLKSVPIGEGTEIPSPVSLTLLAPRNPRYVCVGCENGDVAVIQLQPVDGNTPIRVLSGLTAAIRSIAVEQTLLAAGCNNGMLKLWDLSQGQPIRTFECQSGTIKGIIFHPKAPMVVTLHEENIKLWDIRQRQCKAIIHSKNNEKIKWTPDAQQLISAGKGKTEVWNITGTSIEVPSLSLAHKDMNVTDFAFHPTERVLVTCAENETTSIVSMWDLEKGSLIATSNNKQNNEIFSSNNNESGFIRNIFFAPECFGNDTVICVTNNTTMAMKREKDQLVIHAKYDCNNSENNNINTVGLYGNDPSYNLLGLSVKPNALNLWATSLNNLVTLCIVDSSVNNENIPLNNNHVGETKNSNNTIHAENRTSNSNTNNVNSSNCIQTQTVQQIARFIWSQTNNNTTHNSNNNKNCYTSIDWSIFLPANLANVNRSNDNNNNNTSISLNIDYFTVNETSNELSARLRALKKVKSFLEKGDLTKGFEQMKSNESNQRDIVRVMVNKKQNSEVLGLNLGVDDCVAFLLPLCSKLIATQDYPEDMMDGMTLMQIFMKQHGNSIKGSAKIIKSVGDVMRVVESTERRTDNHEVRSSCKKTIKLMNSLKESKQ